MISRALADGVLLLHLAFIAFVLAGGLLALRWRRVPLVHLPAALWGVFVEASGGICPLTPLENLLRQRAGDAGYTGGFVEHYLVPAIYPAGLTWNVQVVLASLIAAVNIGVYWLVWRRRRR
ncbi:MAG: DUF2784 domain-containing protein [Acidimicrobiia bacterium]|nr:DUF2784 domain-containing protein [Acidimicrobiia bacterium]